MIQLLQYVAQVGDCLNFLFQYLMWANINTIYIGYLSLVDFILCDQIK